MPSTERNCTFSRQSSMISRGVKPRCEGRTNDEFSDTMVVAIINSQKLVLVSPVAVLRTTAAGRFNEVSAFAPDELKVGQGLRLIEYLSRSPLGPQLSTCFN